MNVSGITAGFELPKGLLCSIKDSYLEATFSERHRINTNEQGQVYLDREPTVFSYVVNYLRNPSKKKIIVPDQETKENLRLEFEFFCIKPRAKIMTEAESNSKETVAEALADIVETEVTIPSAKLLDQIKRYKLDFSAIVKKVKQRGWPIELDQAVKTIKGGTYTIFGPGVTGQ